MNANDPVQHLDHVLRGDTSGELLDPKVHARQYSHVRKAHETELVEDYVELIADLIDASSRTAAENALRSLQGEFSQRVTALVERLVELRMYVEAAIDFPEEEIDFLADGKVAAMLDEVRQ